MTHREYVGNGIVVHWDGDRCIHSELCVLGAPSVFDRDTRPWVRLVGASADEVAAVVDLCPSGALSYTRTDGAPNGRRGRPADEDPAAATQSDNEGPSFPVVVPLPDGPLLIRGQVALAREDGGIEVLDGATLCRCGHSGSKPICDGSHVRIGFRAPGAVPW